MNTRGALLGCLAASAFFAVLAADTRPPTDDEMERIILRRLRGSPALDGRPVDVEVSGELVVLTGQVRLLSQSIEAENIAGSMVGISRVDNRLEITDVGRSDSSLEGEVARRLRDMPSFSDSDLEVRVDHGVAVMTGTVEEARLRLVAHDKMTEIPGITDVEDRLTVPSRDPATVEDAVRMRLGPRSLNKIYGRFEVRLDAGVVTLTGAVRTPFTRWQAEREALSVDGVQRVVNQLAIIPDLE